MSEKKRALIVVDVLSTYDFPDAEKLREHVKDVLPNMQRVIEGAKATDTRIVFVNDNFGTWNAGRAEIVERVLEGEFKELVEPLLPDEDVFFVVKARHSIFYETPLAYLLQSEDVEEVVLIGQATEQCILYSALDAHVRHFDVTVVTDACAGIDEDLSQAAYKLMEVNMHANLVTSDEVWEEVAAR